MDLPEIKLNITGNAETNLAEYKEKAFNAINAINTELNTDEDFSLAKVNIKELKTAEENLKQLKEDSLKNVASIYEAFNLLDIINEKLRYTRLELNRIVTKREKELRQELIRDYEQEFISWSEEANEQLDYKIPISINIDFKSCIRNKKSFSSINTALVNQLNEYREIYVSEIERINRNYKLFTSLAGDKLYLFENIESLLNRVDMESYIKLRLLEIEKAEAKKAEIEKAEAKKAEIEKAETKKVIEKKEVPPIQSVKSGELTYQITDLNCLSEYFNFKSLSDDIEKIKNENFLLSDDNLLLLLRKTYNGIIFKIS